MLVSALLSGAAAAVVDDAWSPIGAVAPELATVATTVHGVGEIGEVAMIVLMLMLMLLLLARD